MAGGALTGIPVSGIKLNGLLVTDDLVPMQFFTGSLIPPNEVIPVNQLAAVLRQAPVNEH
jgi:hypothetical protein